MYSHHKEVNYTQHIAAQALAKVQHVRLCSELAGFCCEGCDRL